jgi:hypothetical protein
MITAAEVVGPTREALYAIVDALEFLGTIGDALHRGDHVTALDAIHSVETALQRAKEAIKNARREKAELTRHA